MVKRLRHRPFTAVTGVQIPLESLCADVAQLAEQLICYQQANGSSPFIGFVKKDRKKAARKLRRFFEKQRKQLANKVCSLSFAPQMPSTFHIASFE